MIGNDIIDLKAIRQRSPRHWQRYRDKTMTVAEQEMLADRRYNLQRTEYNLQRTEKSKLNKSLVLYQADNLDIWLAWAVKESVYKLEFQMEQRRYFAPKQIQVISIGDSTLRGLVQGQLGVYNFEVQLEQGFIHALAWEKASQKPSFHCFALGLRSMDAHLLEAIGEKFPGQVLQYQSQPFPHFILDKHKNISVSKSHHGEWQAFAY